jgi:hypothetical protein
MFRLVTFQKLLKLPPLSINKYVAILYDLMPRHSIFCGYWFVINVLIFVSAFCGLSIYQIGTSNGLRMFYVSVVNVDDEVRAGESVAAGRHLELQVLNMNAKRKDSKFAVHGGVSTDVFTSVQIISPYKCYFVDEYDVTIGSHNQIDDSRYTAVLHQPFSLHKSYFFIIQLQDDSTSMSLIKERLHVRSVISIFLGNVVYSLVSVIVFYLLRYTSWVVSRLFVHACESWRLKKMGSTEVVPTRDLTLGDIAEFCHYREAPYCKDSVC